jgi:oxygen-independent coproporphyrinogen-3 oxidase
LRWWNVRTPERYIAKVAATLSPVAGSERLSPEQQRFERLSLALRTPAGVPDAALRASPELADLVERRGGRAVLSVTGRMLASEISLRLEPDPEVGVGSAGILPR